jgi:hypothetical protein
MSKQDLCKEVPKSCFYLNKFYVTKKHERNTTKFRVEYFMEEPRSFDA